MAKQAHDDSIHDDGDAEAALHGDSVAVDAANDSDDDKLISDECKTTQTSHTKLGCWGTVEGGVLWVSVGQAGVWKVNASNVYGR